MDERRQWPRWQVQGQAMVRLPQMPELSHCMIEDINLKGMCVSFNKQLPQKEPLDMFLVFEGCCDLIKVEVNLPWKREYRGRYVYGMSFSKIMDWDQDRVYQYILSQCSKQLEA